MKGKLFMLINGKEININDIVEEVDIDKNIIKQRENGLPLRDSHIEILNKYHIDYKMHTTLSSLIFEIEEVINEEYGEIEDLILLSEELSEINYYIYINK